MNAAGLQVRGLSVTTASGATILDDVEVTAAPGSVLGVVGASGAGKSTLARVLVGHVEPGLHVDGRVIVDGRDILAVSRRHRQVMRRERLAFLPQQPAASLTPSQRVGRAAVERRPGRPDPLGEPTGAGLASVLLPTDTGFRRRRCHELSGGQQQRVAVVRALASSPGLVVLDEPTTDLDTTARVEILQLLADMTTRATLVVVSHDAVLVQALADQVVEVSGGRVVRRRPQQVQVGKPTPRLPATAAPEPPPTGPPVLVAHDLYASHSRRRRRVPVLTGVSLALAAGTCTAVVGPSGSGKTTLARCLAGAHDPDRGSLLLDDTRLPTHGSERTLGQRRAVQLIPQDPGSTLNPATTVAAAVSRPAQLLRGLDPSAADRLARDLLVEVGLSPALAARLPTSLSGGERQRVAIARALAAGPRVLICDEVTSALDPRHENQVIDLLGRLQAEHRLTLMIITHDLHVARALASDLAVLDGGRVEEHGPVEDVLDHPSSRAGRALVEGARRYRQAAGTDGPVGIAVSWTGDSLNRRGVSVWARD